MSQFDPAAIDPRSGRRGAITHPSDLLAKRDFNNFQPRVGLAYTFAKSWVFRGGFGINTVDLFTNGLNQNFEEFLASATVEQPPGDPRIAFRISEGPPPMRFDIQPDGTAPFLGTNFSGRTASWYDPSTRAPYVMNWNSSLQWEFAPTFLLELSYQGSAGVGLLNYWDINAIPLDISTDSVVLNQVFAAQQNYKPYTQFGTINHFSNYGHSTFHSGTVKVEKRLSRGLSFTSFYTYGKAINEAADDDGMAAGITFYNRRLEKGRANYDVNHRTVTYATMELPFGKGRKFMNRGGVLNAFLGGWDLSWIQTFETGVPITFTFAGSPNRYLPGQQRPNRVLPNDQVVVPDFEMGERFNNALKNPYLNINAFAYPPAFTPGNAGRNIVSGPGLSWSQGSIAKEFRFREGAGVQVRFDMQNVFKSPNFTNPTTTTPGSPTPTAIVNFSNPVNFGKITATNGGFSGLGARTAGFVVVKVFF
jgi:hypothetical protein